MIVLYVAIVLLPLLSFPLGNLLGWYAHFGRHGEPFHWSVMRGPTAYMAWLDEHNPDWWRP